MNRQTPAAICHARARRHAFCAYHSHPAPLVLHPAALYPLTRGTYPGSRSTDVDECRRPGACGTGAICNNTPGGYKCSCPEGTEPAPDAQTLCVALITCAGDDECPGNSMCDPAGQCLCPEPNVGNDCRREWLYQAGSETPWEHYRCCWFLLL